MLQRHVNNHFSDDEKNEAAVNGKGGKNGGKKRGKEGGKTVTGVRKSVEIANKSESQKNLKVSAAARTQSRPGLTLTLTEFQRAGVKLKLRPVVFSARIFDFFDAAVMPGLRHANHDLAAGCHAAVTAGGEEVEFTPRVTAMRTDPETGAREANVRWVPENL